MEWSNEAVMEFLDLYEGEPVIWNPNNPEHKERHKVYDAWKRIESQLTFECSLNELKKKKENLMATYRKLTMKVKKSATGSGSGEVYKPEWFAYDKMSRFMHTIYTPRITKCRERLEHEFYNDEDNGIHILSEASSESSALEDQAADNEDGPPAGKKKKFEKVGIADRCMDEFFDFLKQVAAKPNIAKDEICLFCELLDCKLRALDVGTQETAMHEINIIMHNLKIKKTSTLKPQ